MSIPNTNEVRIETSTACNAACVFCPWPTEDFTRPKKVMPTDTYKFYLDKCFDELGSQITQTNFSGFGEIFVDKNIVDKIEYACSKNLQVHVLTNGSMVKNDDLDRIFNVGIHDIRFSLHTFNRDSYDKIMNYGNKKFTFDKVIDSINYTLENKPSNCNLIITAEIVEENKDDIDGLIEEFGDKCELEIWYPHNWIYGKNYRDKTTPKTLDTCGRPFTGPIQIQVDGDVIMCCFDFNNEMVLGNFKYQTLEEIFSLEEDNLYSKIYKHHTNGTCEKSDLICNGCDQLFTTGEIVIYNNRGYDIEDRIKKTSTQMEYLLQ
jgi:MoaA/NifB/PqqE/SkfB family radical SAM enzyme